jgi:nucleoside-diphosphate-sugar epimerase
MLLKNFLMLFQNALDAGFNLVVLEFMEITMMMLLLRKLIILHQMNTKKMEPDFFILCEAGSRGFERSILRPSNIYGVDMNNQSLYSLIDIINRKLFLYIGKSGILANYIHICNIVDALILCAYNPKANMKIFNLSDYSLLEDFIDIISSSLGKNKVIILLPEILIRSVTHFLKKFVRFPLMTDRINALTSRIKYPINSIEENLSDKHNISMEEGINELVVNRSSKSVSFEFEHD